MIGRPIEYTEDIPSRVEKYLTEAAELKELPTIEGLAVFLEISRQTIYRWIETYPAFCDILELLMAKQANKLIQGGLSNTYNSTITKLMLTKHDYRDKMDTDVTTGGDKINVSLVTYGSDASAPVQTETVPAAASDSAG